MTIHKDHSQKPHRPADPAQPKPVPAPAPQPDPQPAPQKAPADDRDDTYGEQK